MTASAATQNAPREDEQDLLRSVRRWIATHCVIDARCASDPRILCREFCSWNRAGCSFDEFVLALSRFGFEIESDGLVGRLSLFEDIEAARLYECERAQTEPGEKG